jgi:LacI family transcriptional regulator
VQVLPTARAQQRRIAGFRLALRVAGIDEAGRLPEVEGRNPDASREQLAALLEEWRPDSVLVLSGPLVLGALNHTGLRVPDNVAVVRYEDLDYPPHLTPPPTCVLLPYGEMAHASATTNSITVADHRAPLRGVRVRQTLTRLSVCDRR